jgi:hypothetical protein
MHTKLERHPTNLGKIGALALEREQHSTPTKAVVDHDGSKGFAMIEWLPPPRVRTLLKQLDANRVTEDGAEAVALAYVHARAGWVVKRRLQREECADWLLEKEGARMAIEVAGTRKGDPFARLKAKQRQISGCVLPADRLAIVVAFDTPSIVAGKV